MSLPTAFAKFLVPELELSLKLVFDNIRNYVIGSAFLGLSFWFQRGAPNAPTAVTWPLFHEYTGMLGAIALATGAALVLLNSLQSWELFNRALASLDRISNNLQSRFANHPVPLISRAIMVATIVLVAVFTIVIITLVWCALLSLVYLMVFTASGARAL